tara:strand:+ start:222 stop:356 length:135 start_codon:yes stop_codon:yes gene_type:complete
MEKKLSKKQLERIIDFRKKNPKKETTHQRRARIKKENPWWIPND